MLQDLRLVALALALAIPAPRAEAQAACPQHFASARAPEIVNPKLARETLPLCFAGFAVLHSGVSRTPLYAAERLTRASVAAARSVDRADAFHEEDRLPRGQRAALRDYVRSGYDRGHLAPAGDMPTGEAQAESFSLANVVPQNRSANRSLWAAMEESVRRLASQRGTLYVVTGTVFEGAAVASLNGRVLVPTRLYKAVHDPERGEAAAYLAMNDSSGSWQRVSIAQLATIAGIDVFPALPDRARARAMDLPEPRDEARARRRDEGTVESWLRNEIHRILRRMWRDFLRSIF